MKGKETAKWSGSQKADKRQARKQKIQDAFTDTIEVEVIPAYADLHKDEKRNCQLLSMYGRRKG